MNKSNAYMFCLKFYTGSFALDYKPQIAEEIEQWITKYDGPVIIDCWGVKTIFAVYMNNLLADLINRLGIERAGNMVSFENLNELNQRVWELSRKHVWNYYTDSVYKECVDKMAEDSIHLEQSFNDY